MGRIEKTKQIISFHNKSLLFDFDGVISRTPCILFQAWSFAFQTTVDVNIRKEEYYLLEGTGVQKTVAVLGNKYNVDPANYQTIIKLKDDYFRSNYTFGVYDGVYELIDRLKSNGIRMALVTGANKYRILESVPENFINQFDVLITSDDIVNTKPHPESYMKAARLLNVESNDCVVLENAPLGIQAAKAAGMFVIAVPSTLPKYHLSGADLILESIVDLLKLINADRLGV